MNKSVPDLTIEENEHDVGGPTMDSCDYEECRGRVEGFSWVGR